MEVAPKRPSLMDLGAVIAPWTHIKQIRLLNSSTKAKFSDVAATSPLRHTFDATTVLDQERGVLTVHASLALSAGDFLRINAEFILDYTVDKSPIGITDEAATAFGKMTGIYNVWPFWREYVYSTSMRTGFPPVTLPLVTHASMLAYYAEKEKETVTSDLPSTPK
jgi:hypothetical protein